MTYATLRPECEVDQMVDFECLNLNQDLGMFSDLIIKHIEEYLVATLDVEEHLPCLTLDFDDAGRMAFVVGFTAIGDAWFSIGFDDFANNFDTEADQEHILLVSRRLRDLADKIEAKAL